MAHDLITKKRKKHARKSRPNERKNPDGTSSTHIMEDWGPEEGKYKYRVTPSLYQNKDGSWDEKKGKEGYDEAVKRGEVYGFKKRKKALKFAHGSYKKGKDKREAMSYWRKNKKELLGAYNNAK